MIQSAHIDEPIGDRRLWYKNLYASRGMTWNGPEPDEFSPANREEEIEINEGLLDGTFTPRNDYEKRYVAFMKGPHPRDGRPVKTVKCKNCGCEWKLAGYPAGKQTKFTDEINCHQLIDKNKCVWLWPNLCQPCADRREAKPIKPTTEPKPEKKIRHAFKDQ